MVQSYKRFVCDKTLFTSMSYSKNIKKCDSAFEIDGLHFLVNKCIVCCNETFVIAHALHPKDSQNTALDAFTSTDLRSAWKEVSVGHKTAFPINMVRAKVLMVQHTGKMFVFNLPRFEMD